MTSLIWTFGSSLKGLTVFRWDLERLEIPQYPHRVESDKLSDFKIGNDPLLDPRLDRPLTDPDEQRDLACRIESWIWNFHSVS